MFGNNGNNTNNANNGNNRMNVNKHIRSFYSDIASMVLSYWNENLSIKINPILSISEDGKRQYDYNRRATTALTIDKATALKTKIEEVILPKIKEIADGGSLSAPISEMVAVSNNTSAIGFEYKNDDKGVPTMYLTIYTRIGQDGNAPADGVFSYKFAKTSVMENYNGSADSAKTNVIESEFMFVYETLKKLIDVYGSTAHAINLDSASKSSYQPNNSQGGNNNYMPQNQNNYSAPISNFGDDTPF